MEAATLISKARTRLLLHYPFWGALCLYLEPRATEAVPTAGTDGIYLYYNPEYIEKLVQSHGMEFLLGLMMHEVLHPALQHIWRQRNRDQLLWNAACDYAANLIIHDQGAKLPPGALLADKYRDLPAEAIYAELLRSTPQKTAVSFETIDDHSIWQQANQNNQENTSKGSRTNSADSSAGRLAAEWKIRLAQATQTAKQRGTLPAGMERLIKEVLYPRVDWRQVLASFVQPAMNDYTFLPPSRRSHNNLLFPALRDQSLEEVVIAIDTSGSVWEFYQVFMSEVLGIISSYPHFRGYLAMCDARVQYFDEISSDSPLPQKFKGGGGTDFRPLFEQIETQGLNPSAVVFLTDGDATLPQEEPPYPVLWVLTQESKFQPPWGAVAYLDLD